MKRQIQTTLFERIHNERACALIGARQVGKSYLLREILKEYPGTYLSLDDPLIREEIKNDPYGYLKSNHHPDRFLFIDEPAKVPTVFDALKILIDENENRPSKICIANSGNYLLLRKIKESLAGRISILTLLPLSFCELSGSINHCGLTQLIGSEINNLNIPDKIDYVQINRLREKMLVWGGYPIPALASQRDYQIRWIRDYLTTYVFPILIEQFQVRNLSAFEKFVRLIFIQSGELLNKNGLARAVGVSQPTIDNFLYQLKAMMLVVTLEVYHRNPKKRLVRQNKIIAIDPLLLHNALNTNFSNEIARELQFFGNIYESFVSIELLKILHNSGAIFDAYYWRTRDGAEVDLIIETSGKVLPFEIKASPQITKRNVSGLMSFLSDHPNVPMGYVIYPGRKIFQVNAKVIALPDWWLLSSF
ncbi:MAG: ATP-binding protein [bacterium]